MQVGVDSVFFPFDYPKRAVLVVFGPVDENALGPFSILYP